MKNSLLADSILNEHRAETISKVDEVEKMIADKWETLYF
jgi:hypothetical protein